ERCQGLRLQGSRARPGCERPGRRHPTGDRVRRRIGVGGRLPERSRRDTAEVLSGQGCPPDERRRRIGLGRTDRHRGRGATGRGQPGSSADHVQLLVWLGRLLPEHGGLRVSGLARSWAAPIALALLLSAGAVGGVLGYRHVEASRAGGSSLSEVELARLGGHGSVRPPGFPPPPPPVNLFPSSFPPLITPF